MSDAGQKTKVLIVEDDLHYATVTHHALGTAGYEVVYAGNGNDGVEKAKECLPDVILLDLLMPGLDGVSVLKQIREVDALANVPIIILTSLDEKHSKDIAVQAGATSFLNKTAEIEVILKEIKTVL